MSGAPHRWVTIGPDGLSTIAREYIATPDDVTQAVATSETYTDSQVANVREAIVPIVVSDTPPAGPSVGDLWVDTN